MRITIVGILIVLVGQLALAQDPFLGTWEGKLSVGSGLRIVFNITKAPSTNLIATLDSPDQGAKGIKVSSLHVSNDSILLEIAQFRAKYSGKLCGDSTTITGAFTQGRSIPLDLKKVTTVSERKRPQTPVGPFPYNSEEVEYINTEKTISYGGTITIPLGKGPFPAALLLTGSGQQNRDEEISGHKPFAVIADHLTKLGFIILRVDDRGVGKTNGDVSMSTTRDFADDAVTSLDYLMNRPEVNKNKIGLIGHSEGGVIAQMIAAERTDIDFVIFLAAPGEKMMKLLEEQNKALLVKAGMPKPYADAYLELYKSHDSNRNM